MENQNSKNIIIVNEDGMNNCFAGFSIDEYPREIFPPIIEYYEYEYIETKDFNPNNDKFKEKLKKSISKLQLEEHLKSLNINLTKESKNISEDEIKIRKTRSNYLFDDYGVIKTEDEIQLFWELIFTEKLKVSPEKHNILLTEGINNTKEKREKMAEIMFETFHIPNLFIAKKLPLILYGERTSSGLIIDFGKDIMTMAPILNGYYLPHVESFDIPSNSSFFEPNIAEKCANCIQNFDLNTKKELSSIYLYGTLSRIERISEQLSHKIYYMYGDSTKIKGISEQFTKIMQGLVPRCYDDFNVVISPEKRYPIWEGALFLSNNLSKSEWISKNEYEEMGPVVVNRKCF